LFAGARSTKRFHTAVSLHAHTHHSRETIAFVPHYITRLPFLRDKFRKWERRYESKYGKKIDFKQGYWKPPLSAREVFESEKGQIENVLGLRALVSLTDHDDIEASARAQSSEAPEVPTSLEWTVPFGENAFFHVGVHNVPRKAANDVARELGDYTRRPDAGRLPELLEMLSEFPETLIVLNHPLWDIEYAGQKRHEATLSSLLELHGERFHALEVNGYRRWRENRRVIQLAESLGLPIVSGGDRHGRDANAILNLTRADTLSDFVSEVRVGKASEVLLMPDYVEPLLARQLKGFADVVRFYSDFPAGHKRWHDRVYFDVKGTGVNPLSHYWPVKGAPKMAKRIVSCLCALGSRPIEPALRLALFNQKRSVRRAIVGETQNQSYIHEPQLDADV
jgi:hypothetical protein